MIEKFLIIGFFVLFIAWLWSYILMARVRAKLTKLQNDTILDLGVLLANVRQRVNRIEDQFNLHLH